MAVCGSKVGRSVLCLQHAPCLRTNYAPYFPMCGGCLWQLGLVLCELCRPWPERVCKYQKQAWRVGSVLGFMVCSGGAQGTGKSTFARLLVNALLSRGAARVAFLDVDCGQPELTVPGDAQAYHSPCRE